MSDTNKTRVSIYKLDISEYIEEEYFYAFYIQRRDLTIFPSRWYIVAVLKEKNLEKVMNIKKLKKSHLYLNPLSLFNYYNMGENKIMWEKIAEKEVDIDLIKNWAYKHTGIGNMGMAKEKLNNDWSLTIDDSTQVNAEKYYEDWNNLEFSSFYTEQNFDFRLALEYCRVNNIEYEQGIKGFNRKLYPYEEDGFLDMYKTMDRVFGNIEYVEIFQELPEAKQGVCLYIPEDARYYRIDVESKLARKDEWSFDSYFKEDTKADTESNSLFLMFQINDKLEPIDSGEVYEEKLVEFLEERGYGYWSGGGTSVDKYGNVEYIELEVEINQEHKDKIPEIISKLEEFGAPVGSKMYIEGKKRAKRFGKKIGIQISINKNTVQLNKEQIAGLYRELKVIMNDSEEINRLYENENEFRMYFYGDTYRDMKKEVTKYLKNKSVLKDASVKKVS